MPRQPQQNKSILKAFYYSICGIKTIIQDDHAFRKECVATMVIIPLALILGTTPLEKALLFGSWFLVLLAEIINSSIEAIVNRISLEIHPLSKKIKDMGSAAVLVSIINTVVVWLVILLGNQ